MYTRAEVLLSVQRALLGVITSSMRAITVGWDERTFIIRVFFDRVTTDNDKELLSEITGEVSADLPEFIDFKEEVIFSNALLKDLNDLDEHLPSRAWVFIRRDCLSDIE